jgi:hypothetical protein
MQQAGCGLHRRPVARHFDRAEDHLEKPALHRGHGDRDLRLYAPSLGAGGRAVFARHWPADRGADRLSDGGPRSPRWTRARGLSAGAHRARPEGRIPQGVRRAAEARLPAREGGRRVLRVGRRARARQEIQARYRRGGRPGGHREGLEQRLADSLETALAWPTASPSPRPRQDHGEHKTGERITLLAKIRLPGQRLHHRRDRAAPVLLQQSLRRLPGLRRAGQSWSSTNAWWCRTALKSLYDGAIAPWANSSSPYQQTLQASPRPLRRSACTRPGSELDASFAGSSCTAPARTRSRSPTTTGCAAITRSKAFEGVMPNLSGAIARRTAPGCARIWRAFQNTRPAMPATASA